MNETGTQTIGVDALQKFCESDQCRPYLSHPFSLGEFTYATDGRVAVRISRIETVEENEQAPDTILKVFSDNLRALDQSISVPKPPQVDEVRCKACRTTGKVTLCQTCAGEGYQECDLGHEHDCEDCDGNGVVPAFGDGKDDIECSECAGMGKMPDTPQGFRTGVIIDGKVCVALGYLTKLHALPAATWSIDHRATEQDPIPFWFDGGEGILMPMRFVNGSESCLYLNTEKTDAKVDDVSPRRSDGGSSSLCSVPVVPLETDGVRK